MSVEQRLFRVLLVFHALVVHHGKSRLGRRHRL